MSIITINGTVEVQDQNGQTHTVHGSSLDTDLVSTDSSGKMGPAQTYEATYEDNDIAFTIAIFEYPTETYDGHNITVDTGTLVSDNLSVSIQGQAE